MDRGDGKTSRRSFLASQRETEHGRADAGRPGKLSLTNLEHHQDGLEPPCIEVNAMSALRWLILVDTKWTPPTDSCPSHSGQRTTTVDITRWLGTMGALWERAPQKVACDLKRRPTDYKASGTIWQRWGS